ncbi:hypothetical protein CAOG_02047, partial [Capsaspora owczarzaki ATCC 30864]|uniref:hypothetical protein n=1 Tax=Capsaspora owczarzaki (strain ATCC 30864) TaxID=595528 RepID=UPI0003520C35
MLHSSGSSYAPGGVPLGQSASDGIGYTPAVSSAPHQPHQPHQQQQSAYGYVFEGQAQSQRQQQQDFYIQPHQSHQMHQQLYPSQAHQAHQGPQGPQGLPSTASYFGAPTATTTAAAAAAAAPAAAFQPQATALQYHTHTPVASSLAPASGQHQYQTPAPPANAAFTGAGSTTPLTAASLTAAINSAAAAASEGATAFNATYGTPVSQLQPQSAHHADPSRTPASSATPLTYSTQTQAGLPSQARVAAYSTPLPPRSLSDHAPPPSQPGQPQSGSPASANAAIHTFAGTMSTPQQDRSSSTPYRDQATLSSNTSTSSRAGASLLGTPAMQQPSHPGAAYSNLPTQQHAQPTGALASGAAAAAAAPSQQSAPANNNVPPSVMQLLSEHVLKEAGLISANERLESLLGEERLERQSFERRTRELAESKDRRIRDLETQLETLRPLQTASNFVDQRVLVSQLEQELDRVLALLERERSQWQQQRESDSAESNRRFAALEADAAAERRAAERAQSERANLEVTVNGLRQEWQSAQSDLTNQLHSAQANVAQLTASLQGANSRLAAAVRDAEQVRGALQTSTTENTRLSQQLMSCESALRQAQSDLQALESDRTVQLQHLRDRFKQQFDSALDVVSDAIQSTPGSSYSSRSSYLGAALPAASSNGRTVGAELFPPLTPAATTTGSAAITPSSFARQNGGVVAGSGIATGPTPVPQQPPC